MERTWSDVDQYFVERLIHADDALDGALADSATEGLPAINVTPIQGKFLALLVQLIGARRILEIGTLGGYSTIWMARALPKSGRILSLEIDEHHAEVARANIERAGLAKRVDIRVAPATESLAKLIAKPSKPFDLVFIDADKERTLEYFEAAIELSHRGTLIVVDNVVRKGEIVDVVSTDKSVRGMQRFMDKLAKDSRVDATALQTVGSKGYDGFVLGLVTARRTTRAPQRRRAPIRRGRP